MNYDTEIKIEISDKAKRVRFSASGLVLANEGFAAGYKFIANDWREITLNDVKVMPTETGDEIHQIYLLARQRKNDIVDVLTKTTLREYGTQPSHEA